MACPQRGEVIPSRWNYSLTLFLSAQRLLFCPYGPTTTNSERPENRRADVDVLTSLLSGQTIWPGSCTAQPSIWARFARVDELAGMSRRQGSGNARSKHTHQPLNHPADGTQHERHRTDRQASHDVVPTQVVLDLVPVAALHVGCRPLFVVLLNPAAPDHPPAVVPAGRRGRSSATAHSRRSPEAVANLSDSDGQHQRKLQVPQERDAEN